MDRRLLLASGAYIDLSEYLLKSEAETLYAPLDAILNKQDRLISGNNIKTINGASILGSGDITINEGITKETDPVFSASPASTITEEDKASWSDKQDTIDDLDTIRSNASLGASAVRGIKVNGIAITRRDSNGIVDLGTVITSHQDISGKQDKLVSGSNIKTINGQPILGSGDIVISGGSSSDGSGAYSEVNHETNDTTFTLTPNTFHIWDEVSSLTLVLGEPTYGVANEYLFQFISGSTATTLSLPDGIKWAEELVINPNKIYQISILKGLASVLEFDNAPNVALITFYYSNTPYSAEEGMTWEQWCNSTYNSTMLSINSGGVLMLYEMYPVHNSSGMLVYGTDAIIENEYYNTGQSGGT